MPYFKLITYLVLLFASANALSRPKYMKACHSKDPDYNKCTLKAAQDVINNIAHGDRKYGIPDLKPLKLPIVNIESGNNFKLSFTNLEVYGLDEGIGTHIEIKDKEMTLEGYFNNLEFVGPYEASGKILVLPIEGKGAANITADNVNITYVCTWEPYEENKITYAKVSTKSFAFGLKRAHFHFENLFNGDKKLGDHINNFMNENWDEVVKDLKPSVEDIVANIVSSIVGNYFKKIPQKDLFPE